MIIAIIALTVVYFVFAIYVDMNLDVCRMSKTEAKVVHERFLDDFKNYDKHELDKMDMMNRSFKDAILFRHCKNEYNNDPNNPCNKCSIKEKLEIIKPGR